MVNLDAAPDFSAVSPVVSGGDGAVHRLVPVGADEHRRQQHLAAGRRRPGASSRATILRGGYGLSYNAGAYSTIARQMVGQPPFAVTSTRSATATQALTITDPLATAQPGETTNNYGVERDYALGVVQTWNADLSRDLRQVWNVSGGYTHTRGSSLDIVRAPNRDPDGVRIDGVQPFLWQSSEGPRCCTPERSGCGGGR